MPIKSNLQDRTPAKDRLKREIILLSHGYSMKKEIPGGKVMVFPWDHHVDEWVMKRLKSLEDRDLILYEIVKRVTPLKNVDNLPIGDVITILLVSRALARESTLEYTATCPECGNKEFTVIKIPDQLEKVSEKPDDYSGSQNVTLPRTKDVVTIRPLEVRDEIRVSEEKLIDKKVCRVMCAVISVNEGKPETVQELQEYLEAIPPADFDFLFSQIDEIAPRLSNEVKHKCNKCDHVFSHILNFDTQFFVDGTEFYIKNRWHERFALASADRGMMIVLNEVPDYALQWLMDWTVEAAKKEKEELERKSAR